MLASKYLSLFLILSISIIIKTNSNFLSKDYTKSVAFKKLKSLGATEDLLSAFVIFNKTLFLNFNLLSDLAVNKEKYKDKFITLSPKIREYNEKIRNYILFYTPKEGDIRDIIIKNIYTLDKVEFELNEKVFTSSTLGSSNLIELTFLDKTDVIADFPVQEYKKEIGSLNINFPTSFDYKTSEFYLELKSLQASDELMKGLEAIHSAMALLGELKVKTKTKLNNKENIFGWSFENYYVYADKAKYYFFSTFKDESNIKLKELVYKIVYRLDDMIYNVIEFEKSHIRNIFGLKKEGTITFALPKDKKLEIPDSPYKAYPRKHETTIEAVKRLIGYITKSKYYNKSTSIGVESVVDVINMLESRIKTNEKNEVLFKYKWRSDNLINYGNKAVALMQQISNPYLTNALLELNDVLRNRISEFEEYVNEHNNSLSTPSYTVFEVDYNSYKPIPNFIDNVDTEPVPPLIDNKENPNFTNLTLPKMTNDIVFINELDSLESIKATQKVINAYLFVKRAHLLLNRLIFTAAIESGSFWNFSEYIKYGEKAKDYFLSFNINEYSSVINKIIANLDKRLNEFTLLEKENNEKCLHCEKTTNFTYPNVVDLPPPPFTGFKPYKPSNEKKIIDVKPEKIEKLNLISKEEVTSTIEKYKSFTDIKTINNVNKLSAYSQMYLQYYDKYLEAAESEEMKGIKNPYVGLMKGLLEKVKDAIDALTK